jgi:homoserine kinase
VADATAARTRVSAPVDRASACVVRVPASTSNLGAGFDCVGVAIDLWLTVRATLVQDGDSGTVRVRRAGTLASLRVEPDRDLIWRGVVAACERAGKAVPAIAIDADSAIPVARGLGSSAAACVAGALLARALLALDLDDEAIVDVAAGLEGHPDNVAPSVYGGAIVGVRTAPPPHAAWHVAPIAVHPSLRLVFAVPDFEVETHAARAVLPAQLPFATAVDAAARSAALVAGLASGDSGLLAAALDDVLHVPHRRALVRGYDAVVRAAIHAGAFGATLSGSGSSIVAIAPAVHAAAVADALVDAWRAVGVHADSLLSSGGVLGATVRADRPAGAL